MLVIMLGVPPKPIKENSSDYHRNESYDLISAGSIAKKEDFGRSPNGSRGAAHFEKEFGENYFCVSKEVDGRFGGMPAEVEAAVEGVSEGMIKWF